jgi:NAD(P)H-hydrate epimerase
MRAADAAALVTVSHETLVARAGTAVGLAALDMLSRAYGRRVVVLAGKGSNGADGRVAAAFLAGRGALVTVIDAADAPDTLPVCDLIIDAAYGTGFHGARTYRAPSVAAGTGASTLVLAVDLPSGLDADTGAAPGQSKRAQRTVTFAALKPGLLQGDGPGLSGRVVVADIGIDIESPRAAVMEDDDIGSLLPARTRSGHKWSTALGVAAGSVGMEGSAILCARGAMAAGAGMVRLGTPGSPSGPWPPEAVRMHLGQRSWATDFLKGTEKCRAIVIGPGLGTDAEVGEEIRAVIANAEVPLVIDADGLTALGDCGEARQLLSRRKAPTVLTPHDGEYARLAGEPPGDDRLAAARRLSSALGVVVLVKGPLTAVATPDEGPTDVLLSSAGVTALATAGSGDVLSGMIGAFLARGMAPQPAAALAAHVHGRAAGRGQSEGLVAGDLPHLVAEFLSATGASAGAAAGAGARAARAARAQAHG